MKNKVMAYQLGNVIRKEYKQWNNKKPGDIGTKPVPRWLKNKQDKTEK
jgi:hypothetical protein